MRIRSLTLVCCMALLGCATQAPTDQPLEERSKLEERTLIAPPSREEAQDDQPYQFAQASPKEGWNDFDVKNQTEGEEASSLRKAFLWLPNRILDLIDVFKIDVGAGPAAGGVVRVTKYAQAGIRTIAPASLRVGNFGREFPVKIEHSSEMGVSPAFLQSHDRKVCPGELGVGIDLFLIGGYAGICFDELADFFGGIFMEDFKHDDLH